MWASVAAKDSQGQTQAESEKLRDLLERAMTSNQVAESQKRAQAWRDRTQKAPAKPAPSATPGQETLGQKTPGQKTPGPDAPAQGVP